MFLEDRGICAGVANPAPIISTFLLEPNLARSVRLDGICTVVDAKHVSGHLDRRDEDQEHNEASAQLAYADRIVLNKIDLVSEEDLACLTDRIHNMNRLATIQRAQKSRVAVEYVLGIGGYALDQVSAAVRFLCSLICVFPLAHLLSTLMVVLDCPCNSSPIPFAFLFGLSQLPHKHGWCGPAG